ncbi:MAG: FHA domain-containing protein [Anaerolineae bacterium]|nr:FHA domain-containing protein [Anaerolineae bacterium]
MDTFTLILIAASALALALVGASGWFVWQRRRAHRATLPYLELEPSGKRFYLAREIQTLGRARDCHIRIPTNIPNADTVSYHHARLVQRNGRWVVLDGTSDTMPSLNGVLVNGKRTPANYLEDGDVITFGALKFRFHLPSSSGAKR